MALDKMCITAVILVSAVTLHAARLADSLSAKRMIIDKGDLGHKEKLNLPNPDHKGENIADLGRQRRVKMNSDKRLKQKLDSTRRNAWYYQYYWEDGLGEDYYEDEYDGYFYDDDFYYDDAKKKRMFKRKMAHGKSLNGVKRKPKLST